MQTEPTLPPAADRAKEQDEADAQDLERWNEDIALVVANTLEPSCAFAFCFGYDFGRRSARGTGR